jgi:hypothetical protein
MTLFIHSLCADGIYCAFPFVQDVRMRVCSAKTDGILGNTTTAKGYVYAFQLIESDCKVKLGDVVNIAGSD